MIPQKVKLRVRDLCWEGNCFKVTVKYKCASALRVGQMHRSYSFSGKCKWKTSNILSFDMLFMWKMCNESTHNSLLYYIQLLFILCNDFLHVLSMYECMKELTFNIWSKEHGWQSVWGSKESSSGSPIIRKWVVLF